jgi:hypothetical protein
VVVGVSRLIGRSVGASIPNWHFVECKGGGPFFTAYDRALMNGVQAGRRLTRFLGIHERLKSSRVSLALYYDMQ